MHDMHREMPALNHHHDMQVVIVNEPVPEPASPGAARDFGNKSSNGPPQSISALEPPRFKRLPPISSKESSYSATDENGVGAAEMGSPIERRSLLQSRSRIQDLNNIQHPSLDPTLTARLEETTLLMRTPRSTGPYSEKLQKKKKGFWYIHGQEPREEKGGRQQKQGDSEQGSHEQGGQAQAANEASPAP